MYKHLEGYTGRTRALRSNWIHLPRVGVMFDAGDGCSTELADKVGSPPVIAITHGHGDHILGLPALVAARQFPSMQSGGELMITYPEGCPNIAAVQSLLRAMWTRTDWERITWKPMGGGDSVSLSQTRFLEMIPASHTGYLPCAGYAVVEKRKKLKPEARGLSQQEIISRIQKEGRDSVEEAIEHTLVVYTGDTRVIPNDRMIGADLVVHDCTFLSASDRDEPTHAALPEILELVDTYGIDTLVLHHLSLRYDRTTLLQDIKDRTGERKYNVVLWDEEALFPVSVK